MPYPAVIAIFVVHELSFASWLYIWHSVQHPIGAWMQGDPITFTKMWILASYANLRIQLSIHILGEALHPWLENLSIYFISFVSSNWIVINHQKWRDWKCNQALIKGFGDNDHIIRELIRFIEMTSREFMFEDDTRNGGALNYKYRWLQTQRGFKFFYILNLSIGKVIL